MGTIFAKLLQEHKWICHITSGEATSDMTYSRVLLQKLCKNCPHPEKPFSNSKTISQIKFPYRIEKLVKSQQEWPGGKTLCRSLVTCKGFFCPVVLLLLLCENGYSDWGANPVFMLFHISNVISITLPFHVKCFPAFWLKPGLEQIRLVDDK